MIDISTQPDLGVLCLQLRQHFLETSQSTQLPIKSDVYIVCMCVFRRGHNYTNKLKTILTGHF